MRCWIASSCAFLRNVWIVDKSQKIVCDTLERLEELIEQAFRDGDVLLLADFDERAARIWNDRVDIVDSSDGPCRCNQR